MAPFRVSDIQTEVNGRRLELPGVSEKDVSVSKEQDLLHVERTYGKFERVIQLPMAVQADRVKATYREGVLEITLPKTEELKPKQVKIDIL